MLISVIVFCDPAHDNSGVGLVDAYAKQSLPHAQFEVIVADNCSRVEIAAAVNAAQLSTPTLNIRHVPLAVEGRAAVLNAAISLAEAPVVAIMADDAIPAPPALASHLAFHLTNPHPLAAGVGPMMFSEALRQDGLRRWLEDSGMLMGVSMRTNYSLWPQEFFFTGNVSVKRGMFDQVGLFNPAFPWITWDDFEFGTRLVQAGGYSQLVSGALAWHEHYLTLDERIGAMRKGGHAAVIHERIGPITRPWLAMLDRAHRQRNAPLRADDPSLELWRRVPRFEALFNRAFLEGYECELRNDRSDLAGLIAST